MGNGIRKVIKRLIRGTWLQRVRWWWLERRNALQNRVAYNEWLSGGRTGSTPHVAKRNVIGAAAKEHGLRVFVETGTYLGEMTRAACDLFSNVYTIEISSDLYGRAVERFAERPKVTVLHGDSAEVLPKLLKDINERCLFWLDGHYCGKLSNRGNKDTPIAEELAAIGSHRVGGHVVLIDDAHCFTGENDYPTLKELENECSEMFPRHSFAEKDNIICIVPIE